MNTPIRPIIAAMFLLTLTNASAFYDPSVQRWINRDPLGDHGGLPYMSTASMPNAESTGGTEGRGGNALESWIQINRNLSGFALNSPLTWIDPFGLVIECSGPDKKKWEELLDRWRKNLPKESSLRKVIAALDDPKIGVTIKPLTGKLDNQGKQVPIPQTEGTPLGNKIIWIDFGKDYHLDNDPKKRKYSNPEALAHELLHAHDDLVAKNYRKHGEGFWDDEKTITNDAKTCP